MLAFGNCCLAPLKFWDAYLIAAWGGWTVNLAIAEALTLLPSTSSAELVSSLRSVAQRSEAGLELNLAAKAPGLQNSWAGVT